MRRIFQGVVVLLATLPRLAMGADLTSYTSKEGKDIIILRGDIAPADSGKASRPDPRCEPGRTDGVGY